MSTHSVGTRRLVIVGIDFALVALSLPLALVLRLGFGGFLTDLDLLWRTYAVYLPIGLVVLLFMRLDRIPWRYTSLADAISIGRVALLLNLLFLAALFLLTRLEMFPRSAIVINTLLLAVFLAGARLMLRLYHEQQISRLLGGGFLRNFGRLDNRDSAVLIGADNDAEAFVRQLQRDPKANLTISAILTNRAEAVGTRIHGVPVRGTIAQMEQVVDELDRAGSRPALLIIASASIQGHDISDLLERSHAIDIAIKRLPRQTELRRAGTRFDIQPLELEDLLARPEIKLDPQLASQALSGRIVLVTGAGGSIGSELTRQLARLGPARLVLVDNSEFNLYTIERELATMVNAPPVTCHLADIRDKARISDLMQADKPDFLFHAAALKHVPLLEDNQVEAVCTNVLGTVNVVDAAVDAQVGTFVMVSTDKAAKPTSIMGTTKRIAEAYCQSLDIASAGDNGTRVMTVRFGNVLGSRGSVVPLFQKQIEAGGPITITDEAATRYFMTIREASQLVIQAPVMQRPSKEAGSIVVLNMGEPVRIVDLARNLVRLSGLDPDVDIAFEFVGLRPGEQLTEQLFADGEVSSSTSHADLTIARPRIADRALIMRYIDQLAAAAVAHDRDETCRLLGQYQSPSQPPALQVVQS
ncbi:MAG: SDR family NAD(P)-dependent oxidoreductase [Hyphomicrobiales bacterium]